MPVKNNGIQTSELKNKKGERKMTAKKEEIEKVTGEIFDSFNDEDRKCYRQFCKDINSHLKKIKTSFFAIASTLYNIYKRKLYEIEGYSNIYDMAKDKFQISRGLCHEYISICDRFGIIDEQKCTDLQPEYKEYEPSKLAVMAKLSNESLKSINPGMSVRDIKKIQREDKNKSSQEDGHTENDTAKKWNKRKELLEITDIANISEDEKATVLINLEQFKQENPDTEYKISITLTY